MTNAIEVTKREMYTALAELKGRIEINYSVKDMLSGVDEFEHTLEAHLEELGKTDRELTGSLASVNNTMAKCARYSLTQIRGLEDKLARMTTERDNLRNRVQVLEMANATSGEVIRGLKDEMTQARRARMRARIDEFAASASNQAESVASAALDGKTEAILSAVVDCQRIVSDWSLESIKAKEAMRLIMGKVLGPSVNAALHAFEVPEQYVELVVEYKFDHGTEVSRSVHKVNKCQHSFHPAFPSGELCTFCGVGK